MVRWNRFIQSGKLYINHYNNTHSIYSTGTNDSSLLLSSSSSSVIVLKRCIDITSTGAPEDLPHTYPRVNMRKRFRWLRPRSPLTCDESPPNHTPPTPFSLLVSRRRRWIPNRTATQRHVPFILHHHASRPHVRTLSREPPRRHKQDESPRNE